MRYLWFIYAIVSLADLILSGMFLSPSLEANPVASWIWSKFGYLGLITFKILLITFVAYPCCYVIQRHSIKVAKYILYFGIICTSLTCLIFGAALI